MSGQDQDVEALADKQVGMSGNYKQVSIGEIQSVWKFLIRDDIERKISFLFGIARITKPHPHDPDSGNLVLFFGRQKDLKVSQKEDVWMRGGEGDI